MTVQYCIVFFFCFFFCVTVLITLRAKLSGAVYCYLSCLCVCNGRGDGRVGVVCVWVCYHNNSKVCASIFTKLGLQVKVGGLWRGKNFWLLVNMASAQCLRLSERFFHCIS